MGINEVLLARGIELSRLWDKHSASYKAEGDPYIKGYYERQRFDVASRLDELCMLADLLGVESYDDFRELIQAYDDKEPTASNTAGSDDIGYTPDPEHNPRKPVVKNKGARF